MACPLAWILTYFPDANLKFDGSEYVISGELSTFLKRRHPVKSISLFFDVFANWIYFPSGEHSSILIGPNLNKIK